MNAFNLNIRFLRSREKLSLQKFGERFGLTRGQVHSYEEKTYPPIDVILQIAQHYNLNLTKFLKEPMNELNFDAFVLQKEEALAQEQADKTGSSYALSLIQRLKLPILQESERQALADELTHQWVAMMDENMELRKELLETMKLTKRIH